MQRNIRHEGSTMPSSKRVNSRNNELYVDNSGSECVVMCTLPIH
jgi:hypothetical protein